MNLFNDCILPEKPITTVHFVHYSSFFLSLEIFLKTLSSFWSSSVFAERFKWLKLLIFSGLMFHPVLHSPGNAAEEHLYRRLRYTTHNLLGKRYILKVQKVLLLLQHLFLPHGYMSKSLYIFNTLNLCFPLPLFWLVHEFRLVLKIFCCSQNL